MSSHSLHASGSFTPPISDQNRDADETVGVWVTAQHQPTDVNFRYFDARFERDNSPLREVLDEEEEDITGSHEEISFADRFERDDLSEEEEVVPDENPFVDRFENDSPPREDIPETKDQDNGNVISFIPERQRSQNNTSSCCITRCVKVIFCKRCVRSLCIVGLVIGVIALAITCLYQFGLFQQALNAIPFLNASLGPAANSIVIYSYIGSAVWVAAFAIAFVIDTYRHCRRSS